MPPADHHEDATLINNKPQRTPAERPMTIRPIFILYLKATAMSLVLFAMAGIGFTLIIWMVLSLFSRLMFPGGFLKGID